MKWLTHVAAQPAVRQSALALLAALFGALVGPTVAPQLVAPQAVVAPAPVLEGALFAL